jgi:hypothetical protein
MRKQLENIEDLVETLCSAAQDISGPVDSKFNQRRRQQLMYR